MVNGFIGFHIKRIWIHSKIGLQDVIDIGGQTQQCLGTLCFKDWRPLIRKVASQSEIASGTQLRGREEEKDFR